MDIGEIISESIRYPINDMDNIKYPLIVFGLLAVPILLMMLGFYLNNDSLSVIFMVILIIGVIAFILIAPGYLLSVIKEGINRTGTLPEIQWGKNIVDTLKLYVVSFIYNIIPGIILFVLLMLVGGISSTGNTQAAGGAAIIVIIIYFIIAIVFALLLSVATLRLANTDSLGEAVAFSEVFEDLKKIGVLKLILLAIVIAIIATILALIGILISVFVPIIGMFIAIMVIYLFLALFDSYAMGLLYSDIAN